MFLLRTRRVLITVSKNVSVENQKGVNAVQKMFLLRNQKGVNTISKMFCWETIAHSHRHCAASSALLVLNRNIFLHSDKVILALKWGYGIVWEKQCFSVEEKLKQTASFHFTENCCCYFNCKNLRVSQAWCSCPLEYWNSFCQRWWIFGHCECAQCSQAKLSSWIKTSANMPSLHQEAWL